jgi:hypothetical protein
VFAPRREGGNYAGLHLQPAAQTAPENLRITSELLSCLDTIELTAATRSVPLRKEAPLSTRIRETTDFWTWLWSDWGKSSLLTRAGIPRIVINLSCYLLVPTISFVLTAKYLSAADRIKLGLFLRNPFYIAGYAIFYLSVVTRSFIESRYDLKDIPATQRFRRICGLWDDPIVAVYWLSAIATVLLFVFGFVRRP